MVAVLDTGIRFDHADLLPVSQGGNVLPGYDFISSASVANDGDGRDADPTDPGDWISESENAPGGAHPGCGVSNSSWHGTEVAALIGATTDNGFGMASVGRNVRVLPVRVLGKCGGFDSDIIAGMRWAAGLDVPGVPANPTPARDHQPEPRRLGRVLGGHTPRPSPNSMRSARRWLHRPAIRPAMRSASRPTAPA